ncbi:MAG: amidohydrolase family protein [Anaerolineae bacterium]|nr:amidohydrolase family protein [Thermoflexales bacterium]MCX7938392.1 amidohydrolase family protein [Thermoflexales bacterium]MDW8053422.1 amidohydrolase family protein [Anaerolineae bacterium]
MSNQRLLTADWVIVAADRPPLANHAVLILEDRIADLGPADVLRARYPEAETVAMPNCVISPGFVDAHRHCYGVLAHGIPTAQAPRDFWAFLNEFWWPRIEDRLDHDMLRAAMDLACYEMIRSGITTFFDCLEAPNAIPDGLFVQAEVVRRWGLRAVLCFEATERVSHENGELGLRENAAFIEAMRREGGLVSGAMCHHTTFTCSDAFICKAHEMAKSLGALLHFHCAEGTYEPEQALKKWGKRTLEHYDDLGVLDETTLASQCVQLSPSEVRIVGERGIRVTTMPLSNCEVGGGIAPVPEMRQAGATVGLGTDGYVSNFFASLRGAFLIHKARLLDPSAMPAREVWQMATQDGARALALDATIGTLDPGKQADLIAIDLTDLPTPVAAHNLFDQLILWRDQVDVRHVMVAGRWLKRDYLVLNADPEQLVARTREAAQRLWGA